MAGISKRKRLQLQRQRSSIPGNIPADKPKIATNDKSRRQASAKTRFNTLPQELQDYILFDITYNKQHTMELRRTIPYQYDRMPIPNSGIDAFRGAGRPLPITAYICHASREEMFRHLKLLIPGNPQCGYWEPEVDRLLLTNDTQADLMAFADASGLEVLDKVQHLTLYHMDFVPHLVNPCCSRHNRRQKAELKPLQQISAHERLNLPPIEAFRALKTLRIVPSRDGMDQPWLLSEEGVKKCKEAFLEYFSLLQKKVDPTHNIPVVEMKMIPSYNGVPRYSDVSREERIRYPYPSAR
ncbi:MAG: hypothetical protein CL912_30935 [Deltaproteobacteria bacterium]|nr:hypothetical protein [Deltaproteobacteria bacterium]